MSEDNDKPAVLEYAKPDSVAPRRFTVSQMSGAVGAASLITGLLLPEDIGSGRFILNPLRLLAVFCICLCGVLYVWARVYADEVADRDQITLRGTLYRLLILVVPVALLFIHHDWNAVRSAGVLSIENPYSQLVLVIFALAGIVAAMRVAWRAIVSRTGRGKRVD